MKNATYKNTIYVHISEYHVTLYANLNQLDNRGWYHSFTKTLEPDVTLNHTTFNYKATIWRDYNNMGYRIDQVAVSMWKQYIFFIKPRSVLYIC